MNPPVSMLPRMSWQEAKTEAERIYNDLRAKHDHGFAGMVIDAMRRLHARDKGKDMTIPIIPLGAHLDASALVASAKATLTEPTPTNYKRERELRGTQVQVAAMLGVHPITIAKRETGAADGPITREAWLAITSLPVKVDG